MKLEITPKYLQLKHVLQFMSSRSLSSSWQVLRMYSPRAHDRVQT